MPFDVRAIGPDEIDELLVADQRGFGAEPARAGSRSWATGELDRTRVAFEAGQMVGVSRTYSFELTMPGGVLLPVAAVSWVSVQPTHRRRGVLTQLMGAMHDDMRAHGEPAAILTASESSIYGRFGYGVAAWRVSVSAARAHVAFLHEKADAGSMRMIDRDEGERVLPQIYDRAHVRRAGMVTRPEFWWEQVYWEYMLGRAKASFIAVHTDADGHDDGFVVYELGGEWSGGLPDRKLSVIDMQAESPSTWISLWHYLFGVDLVGSVTASNVPVDDPLRHIVTDSRRIRVDHVNDHLWLAPFDPLAVLGARSYTVPGRVVIETHAPDGAVAKVAVESGTDGTNCSVTADAADLVCDTAVLGMCALGGNRWSELAAAGRVEVGDERKLPLADAMFLATPAPALLSYF